MSNSTERLPLIERERLLKGTWKMASTRSAKEIFERFEGKQLGRLGANAAYCRDTNEILILHPNPNGDPEVNVADGGNLLWDGGDFMVIEVVSADPITHFPGGDIKYSKPEAPAEHVE